MEQWKPINGTDGRYEVSDLGRVRSLQRNKVRIMPHTKQHHGYHAVMFWLNNKSYCRKVHRLVAQHFIPNPNNWPEVNHIDGNKDNNKVSNLEWCTHSYNNKHAFAIGLKKRPTFTNEQRKLISERVKATLARKKSPPSI